MWGHSGGDKALTSRLSDVERKQTLRIIVPPRRNESLHSNEKIPSSMGTTQLFEVFCAETV